MGVACKLIKIVEGGKSVLNWSLPSTSGDLGQLSLAVLVYVGMIE